MDGISDCGVLINCDFDNLFKHRSCTRGIDCLIDPFGNETENQWKILIMCCGSECAVKCEIGSYTCICPFFRTAHFCECFIKLHHVVFIVMHCCKSGSFYLQRHSQLEQAAETVSIGKRFRFYAEGMPPIGFRYKSTNTLSSFNQALVAQLGYRFAHN